MTNELIINALLCMLDADAADAALSSIAEALSDQATDAELTDFIDAIRAAELTTLADSLCDQLLD